jgi:hypothetical protein
VGVCCVLHGIRRAGCAELGLGAAEQEELIVSADFHLAQANIVRMRASMDDPIMAGFVEQLEPLRACAYQSNHVATAFTFHSRFGVAE